MMLNCITINSEYALSEQFELRMVCQSIEVNPFFLFSLMCTEEQMCIFKSAFSYDDICLTLEHKAIPLMIYPKTVAVFGKDNSQNPQKCVSARDHVSPFTTHEKARATRTENPPSLPPLPPSLLVLFGMSGDVSVIGLSHHI